MCNSSLLFKFFFVLIFFSICACSTEKSEIKLSEASKNVVSSLDKVVAELIKSGDLSAVSRRNAANKFFLEQSGTLEQVANIDNFVIENLDDGYKIPVRSYEPFEVKNNDYMMIYIHGGGWTQGNLDTHDSLCRKIANTFGFEVISVDYRLAPEFPFPTPLDDVYNVYVHFAEKNKDKHIILCGDSAGGNLAAALCIKLHDDKYKKMPAKQILFYPVLSNGFESESFKKFGEITDLTTIGTKTFFNTYAGSHVDKNDKLLCPLNQKDMDAFPNTVIVSAEYDVLLDGQLSFIKKLEQNGKIIQYISVPGSIHGFMTYGKEFDKEITEVLRQIIL